MRTLRGVLTVLSTVVSTTAALITGLPAHGAQVVALDGVVVVEARSSACHALKAVALDGAQRLVVKGSVCMKKSAALHHLTHHDRYVIANLWTEVEIYDFADLRRPRLVRSFSLDETHPPWGGGGFVTEGDGVLLVLGTTVSAELRISGPPSQWRVRNLDVTPELRHRTESLYSEESRRGDPADMLGGDPRTVRLDKGRFEVRWDSTRPSRGVIRHRQYLRAAESGATLLIDTHIETID